MSLKGRTATVKRPLVTGGASTAYRYTYTLSSGKKKISQSSSSATTVKFVYPKKGSYTVWGAVTDGVSTVRSTSKVFVVKR